MTETKRFNDLRGYKRFDSYFDDYMQLWTVSDNENDNILYPCTSENMANEFTELLNELNDENEHYKSIFFELVETALTDTNCRELYCKGIIDIFNKANTLNQAREMIKEHLK